MHMHIEDSLVQTSIQLFHQLDQEIVSSGYNGEKIATYIAGGMGVRLYGGKRPTADIDTEFSKRLHLPKTLMMGWEDEVIHFDTTHSLALSLMHEKYQQEALLIDVNFCTLRVYVLTPVDLVISKLSRFHSKDQEDIHYLLPLVDKDVLQTRFEEAREFCIGTSSGVCHNFKEALSKP